MEGDSVVHLIKSRRSIRSGYQDRAVPRSILEDIIACGLAAPSSKNAQPWRLHVVTDKTLLSSAAKAIAGSAGVDDYVPWDPRTGRPYPQYTSTVVESSEVLLHVPAAVFIENLGTFSGGRDAIAAAGESVRDTLEGYGFELIGIGAAVENMWLAALARGLSAVFMGDVVIAEASIREQLGFTGDLAGVIAFGYSQLSPPPPMDAKAAAAVDRAVWHDD